MAINYEGATFDTVQEFLEFKRAMKAEGAAPAPRPRAAAPRQAAAPRGVTPERQGEPVSYGQGKTIGLSVGSMKSYCPSAEAELAANKSHADVLTRMGLTKGKASEVIAAMEKAGVAAFHPGMRQQMTDAQRKQALEILVTVGGVQCAIPNRSLSLMRYNPKMSGDRRAKRAIKGHQGQRYLDKMDQEMYRDMMEFGGGPEYDGPASEYEVYRKKSMQRSRALPKARK
jgi:hypothetical protein